MRGTDHGGADGCDGLFDIGAGGLDLLAGQPRQIGAEIAEPRGLVAIDVFADAAREGQRVDTVPDLRDGRQQQHGFGFGRQRCETGGLDDAGGHAVGDFYQPFRVGGGPHRDANADILGVGLAGGLQPCHDAGIVDDDQPGAGIHRGDPFHLAAAAMGDLRRPAADIHVDCQPVAFGRPDDRARAMRRHGGFQPVAGADRDELAGLGGKKIAYGARVTPPHGHAGEDQCAGIDGAAFDAGADKARLDKPAERLCVDVLAIGIGRELYRRLMQGFALGHDIARADPLHKHAGEYQMGRRRPDIDAHAQELDFLFLGDVAGGAGEPPARRLSIAVIVGHP